MHDAIQYVNNVCSMQLLARAASQFSIHVAGICKS